MRTIVLGAGVIGIATAYHLARIGHDVTVIEQHDEPGLGASFANGGQISVSHPEPWAGPNIPWSFMRGLGRHDAPLYLRWRWDPAMWSWGLRFLRNCTKQRYREHASLVGQLAIYSQRTLHRLIADTGIGFKHHRPGTLHVFADPHEQNKAMLLAELKGTHGIEQRPLDRDACVRLEPALAAQAEKLSGGIYAAGDETGDAFLFTRALARYCLQKGVEFRYATRIQGFQSDGDRITVAVTTDGDLQGDNYVLALGVDSPTVVRALGLKLPIYPVKGYSITLPVAEGHTAPGINIIHQTRRIVMSRLGDRLRIAGGADIVGYDTGIDTRRAQAVLSAALELFPNPGDIDSAEYWAGLRPMTPDGLPILGATCYRNLYLNTGHGSLGWTLACGSARAVADLISSRTPEIDLQPYSASRFGGSAPHRLAS